MKKTTRNQNMLGDVRSEESANTGSLTNSNYQHGKPERFVDANLNQTGKIKQRYDENTRTVENKVDE